MNIEKLGIKPIPSFRADTNLFVCNQKPVRELEKQQNELFENTFDLCEEFCQMCIRLNPQHENCKSCDDLEYWRKPIVDMTGKTWEEIKEIIK